MIDVFKWVFYVSAVVAVYFTVGMLVELPMLLRRYFGRRRAVAENMRVRRMAEAGTMRDRVLREAEIAEELRRRVRDRQEGQAGNDAADRVRETQRPDTPEGEIAYLERMHSLPARDSGEGNQPYGRGL